MDYTYRLMCARVYMGSECTGENECAVCGVSDRADTPIKKVLGGNFTAFEALLLGGSHYICESCANIFRDTDMRFKAIFYCTAGEKKLPERPQILDLIAHPRKEWVLSLPYSNKKHHWLYAGLSDDNIAYIGTDNRTVVIDYTKYDVEKIINTIKTMIAGQIPRAEIISGEYTTLTRYKFPDIDEYEKIIAPMRQQGAVELFVTYTPMIKEKIKLEGKAPMLTENEKTAARVLFEIAARSAYRANNGLYFWKSFFIRRINRFKELELHEFVSKLSEAVAADMLYVGILEEINNDEEIMKEIRNKTNLIVAMALTMQKEVNNI